jgi:hypothetical protein
MRGIYPSAVRSTALQPSRARTTHTSTSGWRATNLQHGAHILRVPPRRPRTPLQRAGAEAEVLLSKRPAGAQGHLCESARLSEGQPPTARAERGLAAQGRVGQGRKTTV